MKTLISGNILIELGQLPDKGSPWQVRVYKKVFGFRKRISSDWFLDEHQARKFADQVAKDLRSNGSIITLKQRQPGWTLRRPIH